MIAFFDAEYNTNTDDYSLLEIALIVYNNELDKADKKIATYHSYAKPEINGGIIYDEIKELTKIPQEKINKSKSISEVLQEVFLFIDKYNIEKIYCLGNTDKKAMSWNIKNYGKDIPNKNFFNKKLIDLNPFIRKKFDINHNVSLKTLAKICNCTSDNYHSALTDAKVLKTVYKNLKTNNFNKKIYKKLKNYYQAKEDYNFLKSKIKEAKTKYGEEYIRNILNNEPFRISLLDFLDS